jgi:hypothetical protein
MPWEELWNVEKFFDDSLPWEAALKPIESEGFPIEELVEAFLLSYMRLVRVDKYVRYYPMDPADQTDPLPIPNLTVERIARGFGRAIGLMVLHEGYMERLALDPEFVSMLHPHVRQAVSNITHTESVIAPLSMSVLKPIIWGLEETMGCGGMEMFSVLSWMDLLVPNL